VCLIFSVHGVNVVRQTEIQTAETLVPEPNTFEVQMATEKLKRHKSRGTDQIQAERRTICSEIHKLINYIWKKEELPQQWKKSHIVPVHKKGDKTNCSNYQGTLLLLTTYKILSSILLSRSTPYAEEIIWDHQCRF
jgi:hypothetical protein